MDTPIMGSVAPCTTANAFTCHRCWHIGMAPTDPARMMTPTANTQCGSTRSSSSPIGTCVAVGASARL